MGKIYDQLNIEERAVIQTRLEMGVKPAAIARGLGRPASTIWREIRRNGWVQPLTCDDFKCCLVAGGYLADVAHRRAYVGKTWSHVLRRYLATVRLCFSVAG